MRRAPAPIPPTGRSRAPRSSRSRRSATRSATSSTIPKRWSQASTTALAELARIVAPSRWAAAGLAVQRSSLVCWSADDGRALSPVISWQDTRDAAWLKGLSRRAEDVQRLTGLQLSPHYGASKLRWCLDHLPEVRARRRAVAARARGRSPAFLLHRLLEERPFLADASTAARTLLWSPFDTRLVGGAPRAVRHSARGAAARDRHVAPLRHARVRGRARAVRRLQRRPVRGAVRRGPARLRRRLRQPRHRRIRAAADDRSAACAAAPDQRDPRRRRTLRLRPRRIGQRRGRGTRLAGASPGRRGGPPARPARRARTWSTTTRRSS